jgi:UDP-glucose 4-epimerase
MKNVKILMTGVTSFTGCYIGQALKAAGYDVTGVLTRKRSDYTDTLIQRRLEFSGLKNFWEEAPQGSENFLRKLNLEKFDFFVSHGAAIQGYRSPDFDFVKSVSDSLRGVKEIFNAFQQQGLKGIVHSGTVFESVDGLPALSPYGLSKQMVWDALSYWAQSKEIALTKVWIPNPIGSLENEDRLIPIFVKQWKQKTAAKLTVPRLVYDHVPAAWLANFYVRAVEAQSHSSAGLQSHLRPSAFILNNGELVENFREAFQKQSSLPCDYLTQEDPKFKLGITRKNSDPCPELQDPKKISAFWETYAAYWA